MQGFRRHLFLTEKSRKSITPPRAPSTPLPAIVSPISPTGAWPLFCKGSRARAHVGVCGGVRIWDDHRRPRNGSTGRLIDPEHGKQRSLLSEGKGERLSASPAANGRLPGAQGAWPSVTASRSRSDLAATRGKAPAMALVRHRPQLVRRLSSGDHGPSTPPARCPRPCSGLRRVPRRRRPRNRRGAGSPAGQRSLAMGIHLRQPRYTPARHKDDRRSLPSTA